MKIAIIFASKHLAPRYSLVSVVENQLRMLMQHGYQPILLLRKNCKKNYKNLKGVKYRRCLPSFEDFWYKKTNLRKKDRPWLKKSIKALYDNLKDVDLVITHDIVFLASYFVYNLAIRQVAKRLPHLYWLHWIHSSVSRNKPVWKRMKRSKLVIPNTRYRGRVAKAFRCPLDEIKTVYHSLDLLSYPLHPLCKNLINSFDLLSADIIQLYPADTRRLEGKQIDIVIKLFARLKKRGKKVRLIIANSFCLNDDLRQKIEKYMSYALDQGLTRKEILFTSQFQAPRWEKGIPRQVIIELFHYVTNLFIFPSLRETFSLVTLEAASKGNLLVLNENLSFLKNLIGKKNALFYQFGKYDSRGRLYYINPERENRHLSYIADKIIKKLNQEMSLRASQHVRQRFNSNWIFKNQLEPLLHGFTHGR